MKVPRAIGAADLPHVLAVGQQAADGGMHDVAGLRRLEVAQDLGEAEHAHGDDRDIEAVGDLVPAEGQALLAALQVGADRGEQDADQDDGDAPSATEPRASTTANISPSTISEK